MGHAAQVKVLGQVSGHLWKLCGRILEPDVKQTILRATAKYLNVMYTSCDYMWQGTCGMRQDRDGMGWGGKRRGMA